VDHFYLVEVTHEIYCVNFYFVLFAIGFRENPCNTCFSNFHSDPSITVNIVMETSFYCCSSRFTDSKKYEDDFMDCFQLHERRSGEICNACVLLVKRWKKLPAGSERNWRHVSIVLIITLSISSALASSSFALILLNRMLVID
jgi:hypothetical protein